MPSAPTLQSIQAVLAKNIDPISNKPYVCKRIHLDNNQLGLTIELPYPAQSQHSLIRQQIKEQLVALLTPQQTIDIDIVSPVVSHAVQRGVPLLPGVKNIIAIASGKGGVGKSTTAVNLALALAAEGARTGLLDADIYGPSQPLMMGLQGQEPTVAADGKGLLPLTRYGVQTMSIGFLVDTEQAMIWRGPMVSQALQQLVRDTHWDNLDYLIVDLPPGTGDTQLTLAQKVPVTAALIVTTPQDIALLDARRAYRMFEKVSIPILGIIENMAVHICSQCGHAEHIFGQHGAQKMAKDYAIEHLGSLPLDITIRLAVDCGQPTVVSAPHSPHAQQYRAIAQGIAAKIAELKHDYSNKFPKIVIQND